MLNTHATLVFLHLSGVAGMFTALGLELGALRALGAAADADGARRALASFRAGRVLGPLSLLLIVGPGLWLAAQIGEASASWAAPSLAGLLAVIALGAAVTGRRVASLERLLAQSGAGSLSPAAAGAAHGGALRISFAARAGILVVILFVMVVKP